MEDLFIIKIGGETIGNKNALKSCLEAISKFKQKVILVHGGGKKVTELAAKLGITQEIIDGRRITSAETFELCTMVYSGLISKNIVAELSSQKRTAIGLSGADLNCIISKKRNSIPVNYGLVGDVIKVNKEVFENFISARIIPVVNSITISEDFELLNTNADVIAAEIAKEMSLKYNVHLIYCFEKNGVLQDINNNQSVISTLSKNDFEKMKITKEISDGMIPKLETAFKALEIGVNEAKILKSDALKNYFDKQEFGTNMILN